MICNHDIHDIHNDQQLQLMTLIYNTLDNVSMKLFVNKIKKFVLHFLSLIKISDCHGLVLKNKQDKSRYRIDSAALEYLHLWLGTFTVREVCVSKVTSKLSDKEGIYLHQYDNKSCVKG